jgi:hypothetical protein
MTSQGSASGRFTRALAQKNVRSAEIAAKEMGGLSLIYALDYVVLLADVQPERAQAAAIRWHGRLELEPWRSASPNRSLHSQRSRASRLAIVTALRS